MTRTVWMTTAPWMAHYRHVNTTTMCQALYCTKAPTTSVITDLKPDKSGLAFIIFVCDEHARAIDGDTAA